jgi:hypothetical protein
VEAVFKIFLRAYGAGEHNSQQPGSNSTTTLWKKGKAGKVPRAQELT